MKEKRERMEELGILMDVSYLPKDPEEAPHFMLQTFTHPIQDKPTLFMEVISRKGSTGFGQRTIKALFEAVEKLQNSSANVQGTE